MDSKFLTHKSLDAESVQCCVPKKPGNKLNPATTARVKKTATIPQKLGVEFETPSPIESMRLVYLPTFSWCSWYLYTVNIPFVPWILPNNCGPRPRPPIQSLNPDPNEYHDRSRHSRMALWRDVSTERHEQLPLMPAAPRRQTHQP